MTDVPKGLGEGGRNNLTKKKECWIINPTPSFYTFSDILFLVRHRSKIHGHFPCPEFVFMCPELGNTIDGKDKFK